MKRAPRRERGVVLVAFATVLSALLLVGTLGWVMTMTQMQLVQREPRKQAYIEDVQKSLDDYVANNFELLSNPSTSVTTVSVLAGAAITRRWGLELDVSKSLTSNGLPYRIVVAYLPTDTDDRNPPDIGTFKATGQFVSCPDTAGPCSPRKVATTSTLDYQREADKVTQLRLQTIAVRAQLYFKQRVLADPERRVTVNYFRPTSGDCTLVAARDLPCHDIAESLASHVDGRRTAAMLGLSPEDLLDGWGGEILVRNGPAGSIGPAGAETVAPPYSMLVQAVNPYGQQMRTVATQPLQ